MLFQIKMWPWLSQSINWSFPSFDLKMKNTQSPEHSQVFGGNKTELRTVNTGGNIISSWHLLSDCKTRWTTRLLFVPPHENEAKRKTLLLQFSWNPPGWRTWSYLSFLTNSLKRVHVQLSPASNPRALRSPVTRCLCAPGETTPPGHVNGGAGFSLYFKSRPCSVFIAQFATI